MNGRAQNRWQLGAFLSQLFGYIYCMLISDTLLSMPLFGGALYLCGRAVLSYGMIYGNRNRRFLPGYVRKWSVALLAALFLVVLAIVVLQPRRIDSPLMWLMFAVSGLNLLVDMSVSWMSRLGRGNWTSSRGTLLGLCMLLMLSFGIAAACLIDTLGFETGGPFAACFLLRLLLLTFLEARDTSETSLQEDVLPDEGEDIRSLEAFQSFRWMSFLLVMAIEMTLTVVYSLLASSPEQALPAISLGTLCALIFAEAGILFLRRAEKKTRRDPTMLLCLGLGLWLYGVLVCGRMLWRGELLFRRVYFCVAMCSAGASLSLVGLNRVEDLIPDLARFTGRKIPAAYEVLRRVNLEYARLLGDVLALMILSICFLLSGVFSQNVNELLEGFQPLFIAPVALVVVAALVSVFRFPLSSVYIRKLKRFLRINEAGSTNPALKKQLDHVVLEHYRQPFLARAIKAVLRPIYHHRRVGAEHLEDDPDNPVLFLCNHGEVFGPIVCELFLPVPFHSWAISMMMSDRREVSSYLYENTFSPKKWPEWLKKGISNFAGWLSVTVMQQVEAIPVYRDQPFKLRETIRRSIEALEAGDHVLIFPENPEGKYPKEGIGRLSPGFVMLAEAYWRKTGKRLRMMPLYVNKNRRTLSFGEYITFNPDVPFAQEQQRVVEETVQQIEKMAQQQ